MNENINLVQLLKGHIGERFFNPLLGSIPLENIDEKKDEVIFDWGGKFIHIPANGLDKKGNLCIFPSEDESDWDKWYVFNTQFKTWTDMEQVNLFVNKMDYSVDLTGHAQSGWTRRESPIENSAMALMKIKLLLSGGFYGPVVTCDMWTNSLIKKFIISPNKENDGYEIIEVRDNYSKSHIVFTSYEFAESFLTFPENVNLLDDFFGC